MRRLRLPFAAFVLSLALAAPAGAVPIPGAGYGGGLPPERFSTKTDSGLVSVAIAPDGVNARIVAILNVRCARGAATTEQLVAKGQIGPDGRLRLEATTATDGYLGRPVRRGGRAIVDVGFDGAAGSGTVRIIAKSRRGGRRVSCDRTVPVQVRSVPADPGAPGAAAPGGLYFGTGDVAYREAPTAFAFRLAPDARRVRLSLLGLPIRCPGGGIDFLANITPSATVRADGSFRRVERYSIRLKGGGRTRTQVVLNGRFTAQGLTGNARATDVTRARGRRAVRCATPTIRFAAVR